MKSAVCLKGRTTNQSIATMAYGIYEKYLLFELYHCFLSCFTEASFEASLRVSHAQSLIVTCMITPSLLPHVRPSCGCLHGVGIKVPLLSHFRHSTNTTELTTLRLSRHDNRQSLPYRQTAIAYSLAYRLRPKGINANHGLQAHKQGHPEGCQVPR